MENWFMLSLVGKDQPGIVARLSAALCKAGCNLGNSTMGRMGKNFSIMVMVQLAGTEDQMRSIVKPIADQLGLTFHIDTVEGGLEHHVQPDVRISVYADDRRGIVEDVTTALADAGLNILHLDSNVEERKGSHRSTYYLHIEGTVSEGLGPLYKALDTLSKEKKMNTQLIPINPDVS